MIDLMGNISIPEDVTIPFMDIHDHCSNFSHLATAQLWLSSWSFGEDFVELTARKNMGRRVNNSQLW